MEKISYEVDDGAITISGNYWEGAGERAVILLHMMPATKESWNDLAGKLHERGFDVLAIDLRGHGGSGIHKAGGKSTILDYKTFDDTEHQASINDVEGAREWLAGRGIKPGNIAIGGASIGANLAIRYMGDNPECLAGFALSPGLNYRGIETLPAAKRLLPTQRLYIAAAKDDDRIGDSFEQATKIFDATAAQKEIKIFETGGHGTNMLIVHPNFIDELVGWFLADMRE
jgi:alpha-beta hydrolase superfamily lysophospholipase